MEFTGIKGNGPVGSLPGYTFRIIERKGRIALLAKSRGSKSAATYEVAVVRSIPFTRFPDGRGCPPREALPNAEKWGVEGWSYQDIDSARQKFAALTA